MALKIQLATADQVLNCKVDPEGLVDFELELKRSSEHDGLFYEFGVNLKFFKEGRRLIRDIYEEFGIDGKIEIRIFEYQPNKYKFEKIYIGQLRLQDYEIDEIGVTINVEEDSIERSFINRIEQDNSVPMTSSVTVPPRIIPQQLKGTPTSADIFKQVSFLVFNFDDNTNGQSRSGKAFVMFDLGSKEVEEFESLEQGGLTYATSEYDAVQFLEILPEEQGKYDFDFRIRHAFSIIGRLTSGTDVDVGASSTHTPPITIKCFFEIRNENNNTIQKTQIGPTFDSEVNAIQGFGDDTVIFDFEDMVYSVTGIDMLPKYRAYCYYEVELSSDSFNVAGSPARVEYDFLMNAGLVGFAEDFKFEVNAKTAYPETNVQITFPYQMFENIVNQNTNGLLGFKSDFFAKENESDNTEDGEGSLVAITNGHKLRQENTKRVFTNFKNAFESLNALYCLGWGFEVDENGDKFVRIEKKEYFYDKSEIVYTVNKSKGLLKRAKQDFYFTRVEVGYPDYENVGAAKGTDEFNTRRKYATNISQADNSLELISTFRASCYEIEGQRRQELNTDANKLDDENFWIYLKRSTIDGNLFVETGSSYLTLGNIEEPDSVFNIGLRPSLFMENWKPILSAVTFRQGFKTYEFKSGTRNYEFSVIGVSEDRDIEMSNSDALYICDEIEFETSLTPQQRNLISNNPRGLISVKDWVGNNLAGFLISSKFKVEEKSATFILLKANVLVSKKNKIIKTSKQ